MHKNRFIAEVELEKLAHIVEEIKKIISNPPKEEPDIILKTATASFMAILQWDRKHLKTNSKYYNYPLPKAENWHYKLFTFFCDPPNQSLPVLFNAEIKMEINELRKFRHRVHHGYSFTLEWNDL